MKYTAIIKLDHPVIQICLLLLTQMPVVVGVGLCQGCHLSPILFVMFVDKFSRRSGGEESVQFGDLRIVSQLFADDLVLLASSFGDFQQTLGRFAAECEAVGVTVSISKSEAMVPCRKTGDCTLTLVISFA